jgi:serine/threonine protein kinase
MEKTLGVGSFGSVRLATKRNNRSGHKYAIKLISKAKIDASDAD